MATNSYSKRLKGHNIQPITMPVFGIIPPIQPNVTYQNPTNQRRLTVLLPDRPGTLSAGAWVEGDVVERDISKVTVAPGRLENYLQTHRPREYGRRHFGWSTVRRVLLATCVQASDR